MATRLLCAVAAMMTAGVALAPTAGAQTPASDDASLRSLSITSPLRQTRMFPLFDAEVLRYDVAVPSGETEVTVKAATNHPEASVVLESTRTGRCCIEELDYNDNTGVHTLELRTDGFTYMTVKVTAEDGSTTREYRVFVDAALSDALGWRVYNDVPMDRLVDDSRLPSHYVAGVWADDSRVFVTGRRHDPFDQKLFAFNAADSSRQTDDEFVIGGDAGIWSDGTTLWSMDSDGSLRKYNLSDGSEDASLRADVSPSGYYGTRDVDEPRGIWSDGSTLWVVDRDNTKVFAFGLPGPNCANSNNYCRQSSKDFDLHADNDAPWGITAGSSTLRGNVDTWWVTDTRDRKIYAYNRSDDSSNGTRNSALDIDLSQLDIINYQQFYYGLAATDTIMYVAEYITGRVYSFSMPGVSGPVALALVSSDATLRSLSLTDISPDVATSFDSRQTEYYGSVAHDVTSTTVTATVNDSLASYEVKYGATDVIASNRVVPLAEYGDHIIKVVVTAQDGTIETYRVTVTRPEPSADATLSGLELLYVPFTFQSGTYSYTPDAVANSVAQTTVTATPNSEHAKLVVIQHNGNEVGRNDKGKQVEAVVALDAQEVDDPVVNTITVEVTAEDDSQQTYTVTVTRERALSDNAELNDLVLMYDAETVQLVPMFDALTYSYRAEVLYGVTSLVVKYELRDTNAKNVTVRIGGAEASNLDNPGMVQDTTTSVDLSDGENTLTVEVTAEDGIANKAYEVIIDRAVASNDATLASLSLDPGTLDRDFYRQLFSIDATVGHDDATTKLSIVRSDGDKATVVVKHGGAVERHDDQDDTVTGGTPLTALTADPLNPDALNYTIPLAAPVGTQASETVVTIEVTAEDGTFKVYEVEITRPVEPDSDVVTLRTLTLTNPKNLVEVGLNPPFTSGTTTSHFVAGDAVTRRVGNDVTQVVVVAEPTDGDAQSVQLLVDGVELLVDLTNSEEKKEALADGVTVDLAEPGVAKVLSIKVTAEVGNVTETYIVTITRDFPPPRGVTTLDSLVLRDLAQSRVTLDPLFATEVTSYATSVDHGVTKLEVIAGATDTSGSTVAVTVGGTVGNGGTITDGTPPDEGGFVPLDVVGENVIRVVVTAENGTDTETYTVTVTRRDAPADNVATLNSLTVDGEDIGFMPDTYSYTVHVLNGVDSTTVRAVATSANASVTASPGSLSDLGPAAVSLESDLVEGDNEITVVVTAENGIDTDKKTYTVTVNRAAPNSQPPVNSNPGTYNPGTYNPGTYNPGTYNPGGGSSNTGSSTVGESSGDASDSDSESDDVTPLDDADDAGTDIEAAINALHRLGVFTGTLCQSNRLCPNDPMQRWIAAVWLVRLIDGDDPAAVTESRFEDVNASSMWEDSVWYAPHVERLADLEVTVGCTQDPLRFCPDVNLTRAQVASWVARAFDLESAESQGFADAVGSVHEANINAVVAAGVMSGCSTDPKNFCLDDTVTKGEMARYVYAARNVSLGLS